MTRLFVAIWPSPDAVAAIAVHLGRVQTAHPELRWQPPERWHLTCAFLGPTDPARAGRRIDRLLRDPPGAEPLRVAGAGTFGPILWLGIEHGAWLDALARRIQRGLHTADQRFRPHITVARGRGPDARDAAAAALPDLLTHDGPPWTPTQITLVESVTGPAPQYRIMRRWPLGPGSAGRHPGLGVGPPPG